MNIISASRLICNSFRLLSKSISYIQGQSPSPKLREYFYYIDHQGMLFLDDAKMKNFTSCFKDKVFLEFFFKRIQCNDIGRYEEDFPYWAPCGRERNFIRCDDRPIVLTHLIESNSTSSAKDFDNVGGPRMSYGHTGGSMSIPFEPATLHMSPETGRVYHVGPERSTRGVALVRSKLAVQLSSNFQWNQENSQNPSHFVWEGRIYELTNEVEDLLKEEPTRFRGLFNR